MFNKKTIRHIDVRGKRVLVRVDYNVPLTEDRKVTDDTRIKASLATIKYLIEQDAKVILVSHLGRPKGVVDEAVRMKPVARRLSELLGKKVTKVDKTVTDEVKQAVGKMKGGDILLLENVRFNPGEKENEPGFAQQLAGLADVFVNDAFGAAHRAHASTVGITQYLPAVAGFLLEREVVTLSKLLESPDRPFFAVLGGNKVSDKIGVIDKFCHVVDAIFLGGGMCFTFLKAKGVSIGRSIYQEEEVEHVKKTMVMTEKCKIQLHLPVDVVVAKAISDGALHRVVPINQIPDDWMGLDIGPKTSTLYRQELKKARTIFWNGPMGVFEIESFADGTRTIAQTVAESSATTIVGGGDSDVALRKFGVEDRVSFVSTGGGASLKLLEGEPLPGVEALLDK